MPTLTLFEAASIIVAILVVDLALSGDNALVIGSVAAKLQGKQRRQAVLLGGLMAAILRIVLSIFAVSLLQLPFLNILGGLIVFVIAVQMLHETISDAHQDPLESEMDSSGRRRGPQLTGNERLIRASVTILLADFSMSLDNVLVIAALARGYILLLVLGLAVSVAMLLLASSLVVRLIERFPILLYGAAGILAWTAGAMVLHDKKLAPIIAQLDPYVPGPLANYVAPFFLFVLVVIGLFMFRRARNAFGERRQQHETFSEGDQDSRPEKEQIAPGAGDGQ